MVEKLKRVVEALRKAGLTFNIRKCEFMKETITFLGHELTAEGILPGKIKTQAVSNFPIPTSVADIRRFLGLSGYFSKFVPGYAIVSEPLRKFLRKNQKFEWKETQEAAFEQLKSKLVSGPILVAYRIDAEQDASSLGLAGVLIQREKDDLRPIAYYSRATSLDEPKFHSYELETLAVVESLERFKYYIYGQRVKIKTDCNAL